MTYSEAKAAINNIVKDVDNFRSSLKSLISSLNGMANGLSKINYEAILHEQLLTNIKDNFTNVDSDLKSIVSACSDTFNNLVQDANRKIVEIVDSYNNVVRNSTNNNKIYLSYKVINQETFTSPRITNI